MVYTTRILPKCYTIVDFTLLRILKFLTELSHFVDNGLFQILVLLRIFVSCHCFDHALYGENSSIVE